MKRLRLHSKVGSLLQGKSRGLTLVELVIAMALMGIIVVALLGGLSNAIMALHFADVQATAESLARSVIEYEKSVGYDADQEDYVEAGPSGYEAYTAEVSFAPVEDGLQQITVVVSHSNKEDVITLVGYKADR